MGKDKKDVSSFNSNEPVLRKPAITKDKKQKRPNLERKKQRHLIAGDMVLYITIPKESIFIP